MNGIIAKRLIASVTLLAFVLTSVPLSYAQTLDLPQPGTMVTPTSAFAPATLKGMKVYPDQPLRFDFVLDPGRSALQGEMLKDETTKIVRYFLASLTTPEKDLWVNLSPYENDRIIPENFGLTEMGRDLLAQDYILKQLTASVIYPESTTGKTFWSEVYKKAQAKYGTIDIPVDTFNKVWITPDEATVYVHGNTALVKSSHLKVLLESDYLARNESTQPVSNGSEQEIAKAVLREVVIPILEKEVNEGAHFAKLRQIYRAMVLAIWFKRNLKESLVGRVYMDKSKVRGIDLADKDAKDHIWQQYVAAFKKGVFNYIKEEQDELSGETIPRKYFSGGFKGNDKAMHQEPVDLPTITAEANTGADAEVKPLVAEVRLDQPEHTPLDVPAPVAEVKQGTTGFQKEFAAHMAATFVYLYTGSTEIPGFPEMIRTSVGHLFARLVVFGSRLYDKGNVQAEESLSVDNAALVSSDRQPNEVQLGRYKFRRFKDRLLAPDRTHKRVLTIGSAEGEALTIEEKGKEARINYAYIERGGLSAVLKSRGSGGIFSKVDRTFAFKWNAVRTPKGDVLYDCHVSGANPRSYADAAKFFKEIVAPLMIKMGMSEFKGKTLNKVLARFMEKRLGASVQSIKATDYLKDAYAKAAANPNQADPHYTGSDEAFEFVLTLDDRAASTVKENSSSAVNGGIDLNSKALTLSETGGKVDLGKAADPAMLEKGVIGFVPVVISIMPMNEPRAFFAGPEGGGGL